MTQHRDGLAPMCVLGLVSYFEKTIRVCYKSNQHWIAGYLIRIFFPNRPVLEKGPGLQSFLSEGGRGLFLLFWGGGTLDNEEMG